MSTAPAAATPSASSRSLLLGVFVLSGFAGLIYQSIWSHYLGIFLGHAAYAQALVLAIFMGGMAAGAMWIARSGERWRNLIRSYALIEAAIGVLGLGFHWIFTQVAGISYDVLIPAAGSPVLANLLRWAVAAALIIPQTVLLGMTFPLMSGGLIRRFPKQDGNLLGGLYFTNSIGAAIGALAAAFILLPQVGLPGAMLVAGVLNLLVAALALWLARAPEPAPLTESKAKTDSDKATLQPLLRLVLLSTALSGAASFAYEIIWIRMLGMAVGSTLHAFELMLASFIAGIAFGGLWVRKHADHAASPLRLVAWMQVGMGLAALFSLLVYSNSFSWVSFLMRVLEHNAEGYALYTLGTAVIAILIMLPAAFFAGTTLPLFTLTLLRAGHGERAIGQVYAWNTIGSIVGVFAAMHLLIPALGLKIALIAAAAVDMGIGVYLLRREADGREHMRRPLLTALATLAAVALAMQVNFDPAKLASGVFRYGNTSIGKDTQVVFYRDGKTASVSVRYNAGSKHLSIATNGKPDAAVIMDDALSAAGDEPTMALLAALPLAMHANPKEIGVIGFGSGMSSHTLLGDARVQRVDTIEIEPVMAKAARAFGKRVERAFNDPRSNIIFDDAKAYFSGQQARYDIIISEPSNPWISGIGALFAKEFYQFIPRHLKPDGLFVQWVQLYEIDDRLVSSIMQSLTPAFSDYQAYLSNSHDLIIIATPAGTLPPLNAERILSGTLGKELARLGFTDAAHLQFRRVADARVLRAQAGLFNIQPNSYYYPVLSLEAPKTRFIGTEAKSLTMLGHASPLLLEALDIRQPLPSAVEPSALEHFPGEMHSRWARLYARLMREGEAGDTGNISGNRAMQAMQALRMRMSAQCGKPLGNGNEALPTELRQLLDYTLPFLDVAGQQGVLIGPQWLGCNMAELPQEIQHALALSEALAKRDWLAASALGRQWLQTPSQHAQWRQAFDDVALSAVLLNLARQSKWHELQQAEETLGRQVQSAGEYMQIRILLLSMAENEQNR
ncbi:spermidine synthase [Lysobacteraceae bacterium NML07-0707]|nr:spermidine synthase [Xanthomonadaceae bacterium NML07-0707]